MIAQSSPQAADIPALKPGTQIFFVATPDTPSWLNTFAPSTRSRPLCGKTI